MKDCLIDDDIDYSKIKKNLTETFNDIFNKVLTNFYVDYQEHITLAIYVYCPATNEYLDFISCKPNIMNTEFEYTKGRIWNADDNSHICHAARQIKLNKNTRDFVYDNINEELPPVKNSQPSDVNEYVSSISIPILCDENEVKAIISLTSNYPARFKSQNDENYQEQQINKIFVDTIYAIAQIIEIIFRRNEQVITQLIFPDILREYQKSNKQDELKDYHLKICEKTNPFEVEK